MVSGSGSDLQMMDYAGISGGADPLYTAGPRWDPSGHGLCSNIVYSGRMCHNGLLPVLRHAKIRDAIDGTSNTILVGEQSGTVNISKQNIKKALRFTRTIDSSHQEISRCPPSWHECCHQKYEHSVSTATSTIA